MNVISFLTPHSVFHLQNLFYHDPQIDSSPPLLEVRCCNSPSAKAPFSRLTASWTPPGCGVAWCLPSATPETTISVTSFESHPLEKMASGRAVACTGEAPQLCFFFLSWICFLPLVIGYVRAHLQGRNAAPDSSTSSSSPNSALPDDECPEIPSYWVYAFMGSIIWTYTVLIFFCQLVERAKKIGTLCSKSAEVTFRNLWLKGDFKQLP